MKYTNWEHGSPIDRKMYPHIIEVIDPWGKSSLYPTRNYLGVAEWINTLTYNLTVKYGKCWDKHCRITWEDGNGNLTFIDQMNRNKIWNKCWDKHYHLS